MKSFKYVAWILGLAALRLLSLKPAIIDDDEAWFSASAKALTHPFDFYTQAPDNKPPGTVWFYSLFHGDPQLTRFALVALIILTAFFLGQLTYKITRSEVSQWVTTGLLISTSAIFPKLSAVTNEGLILVFSSAMLSIWAIAMVENEAPSLLMSFISGLLMAGLFLIKQTSFVYLVPIAYSLYSLHQKNQPTIKAIFIFSLAFIIPSIAAVVLLGADKYFYWNFTYAATVLTAARKSLFSEGKELTISVALLGLALWPLLRRASKKSFENPIQIYLTVWFFSALAASFAGWGLFLHYFIPMMAPLCLACGIAYSEIKTREIVYVSAIYTLGTLLFLFPYSGSFWGTDLLYYQGLSREIQNQTQASDHVFVWGGNAMPIALSGRPSLPSFITSRFSVAPYSTPELESRFQDQLAQSPPQLFIDLHERHDNRFGTSPLSIAWLKTYLEQHYTSYQSPTVPWVTFYRLSETPSEKPLEFTDRVPERVFEFGLISRENHNLKSLWKIFSSNDLAFRTWESLELLKKSDPAMAYQKDIRELDKELRPVIFKHPADSLVKGPPIPDSIQLTMLKKDSENAAEKLSAIYLKEGLNPPLPLEGRAWWISYAIKSLQPTGI